MAPIAQLDQARTYAQAKREFRQILAEMELLSYGKTQAFNPAGGHSTNPDPTPPGETRPLHHQWQARWDRTAPSQRPELVRDARTDLEAWRIRCVSTPDEFDENAWIIEDGAGYTPDEVARRYNTTPTRIRRLRARHERDTETGHALSPAVDNSSQRVRYLHAQGCTLRQIQMQTGVSKSAVHRLIRQAA